LVRAAQRHLPQTAGEKKRDRPCITSGYDLNFPDYRRLNPKLSG